MLIVFVYIVGLSIIHDALAGTQGAWFSELFSTNTRSSGRLDRLPVLGRDLGLHPAHRHGRRRPDGLAWSRLVYLGCGLLGLVGALLTRETWGPKSGPTSTVSSPRCPRPSGARCRALHRPPPHRFTRRLDRRPGTLGSDTRTPPADARKATS